VKVYKAEIVLNWEKLYRKPRILDVKEGFVRELVCETKNPRTGKRLTARMNKSRQEDGETVSNRQVGYGLVFGVPKSLSVYLAITGDQVVENIARSAVDETMRAMEAEMQSKVRKGGLHEDRRTGELLYSKFFHRDSRPINGLSDPHWHVHCFLHNATFDPVEQRWKSRSVQGADRR
jgi:conjugative relaxase-like TrwC/TraI family protein